MEILAPQQVDIEVTSRCNLACKLCPSLEDPRSGDMDPAAFHRILDRVAEEIPSAQVVPWLNGEPLLHPAYPSFLAHLREAGLKYYVTTNGTLDRAEVWAELLHPASPAYQVIFSLDGLPGPESRSIEIARPGTNREALLKTISGFLLRKLESRSPIQVALKICERGQDWEEIENFIAWGLSQAGVDFVVVGKPLVGSNPVSMRIYPCQYSDHKFMVIKSDLRLVPCAYNQAATRGDIINFGTYDGSDSILAAYNNPAYTSFREAQARGAFPAPCASCAFPYTGAGWDGVVSFRAGPLAGVSLFHRGDYYNRFYSLRDRAKPLSFYTPTPRREAPTRPNL